MKLVVVIPAYNEEKNIGSVLEGVKKYTKNIIVIDDGSEDKTSLIAKEKGALVYSHFINRGLGGALSTGIKAALRENPDIIITLDADGQHDPNEIPKLIKPTIEDEADFVIGSRFLEKQQMPILRKFGNYFYNLINWFLFGIKLTDTQSGMRAFNKKVAESLEIVTNGMEVSSEIIKEINIHNFKIKEVPIKAIYTSYSLSKGQGFTVGLETLIKLLIFKLTE
jgi:glycosyltransferase involved in cell wall biosynthesis